jgi:hypothetical protein
LKLETSLSYLIKYQVSSVKIANLNIHKSKSRVYNVNGPVKPNSRRGTKMNEEYYELEDVIKLLNKSRSTIIREANEGKIPTEGEKRNRRYPKEAIDTIAAIEESKRKKKSEPRLIFSPSTPNDLWQEVAIGRTLYGDDDIVSYRTLMEWREINDEMFMSLKSKGKVVGYSSLMPLEEEAIISLLKDEIREENIPLHAIKQWSDPGISVYVASVTVKPVDQPAIEKERAGIVIANTIKWALSLDRQFRVKNWYSIGATEEGQKLLESLGFDEIISLYNGERKGYHLANIKKSKNLISRIKTREELSRVE